MASVATTTRPAAAARSSRHAVLKLAMGMTVIVAAIAFLAYQGLSNALVYYITPSQLMSKGSNDIGIQLRLGGEVKPHSLHWNATTKVIRFTLEDPRSAVAVTSSAVPPAMLRNGAGAVVQGTFNGRVFHATSILVKHDADYVAPKPGQLPASDNYAHK